MMKITVDAESLVSGVKFVSKNFDNKDDAAFIALVVGDGEGYLLHENAVSLLKAPIKISQITYGKGEEEEEVRMALNGAFLQKLASVLSRIKGEVTLSKNLKKKTSPLNVTAPTGRFTIPVFDSKVPDLKKFDSLGFVDNYEYFDSLSRLSKICDLKHGIDIPIITVITLTFDVESKSITMVATDRYALGEMKMSFTPGDDKEWLEENPTIFIPVEFSTLISPEKDGGSVNLIREPKSKKFGYAFDDGRVAMFSLKSVEKHFDHTSQKDKVLETINTTFLLPTRSLKQAISSISSLAWEENNIFLNLTEDGEVTITDSHEQNVISLPVDAIETVDEESAPEGDIRLAFVREVLNKGLSPITADEVVFGFLSEKAPVALRNADEDQEPTEDTFVLTAPALNK